jgi:hypothetical protein
VTKSGCGGFQLPAVSGLLATLPRTAGLAKLAKCDAVRNIFDFPAESAGCEWRHAGMPPQLRRCRNAACASEANARMNPLRGSAAGHIASRAMYPIRYMR